MEIGKLTWLEGRAYEAVRRRDDLQVRDSMLQAGEALLRSRGAFMNRRGAMFSKRCGIRYRKEPVWFQGRVYVMF